MNVVFQSQRLVLPFALLLAVIIGYRAFRYRNLLDARALPWLAVGVGLLLVGVISTLLSPYYWWIRSILDGTTYASFLLIYFALRFVLAGIPPPRSWMRDPTCMLTLLLGTIAMGLDLMRMQLWTAVFPERRPAPFNYPRAIEPAWFVAYWHPTALMYFLHNVIQVYLLTLIVMLYIRTIRQHSDLVYVGRRCICMTGFLIAAIGTAGAALGVVCWLIDLDSYRMYLVRIYQIAKIIAISVLAFGFLIPHGWLAWLMAPLVYTMTRRQQQHDTLLFYLHEKMIQLVPQVHLPHAHDQVRRLRSLIEISDARQLIFSHISHRRPIPPKREAEYLFQLLSSDTVIHEPGPYLPSLPSHRNLTKHNYLVAVHLRGLERGQPASSEHPVQRPEDHR